MSNENTTNTNPVRNIVLSIIIDTLFPNLVMIGPTNTIGKYWPINPNDAEKIKICPHYAVLTHLTIKYWCICWHEIYLNLPIHEAFPESMVKSKSDILVGTSPITLWFSVYAFSHNTLPMPKLAPELKDSTFTNKDESICMLNIAQTIQKL